MQVNYLLGIIILYLFVCNMSNELMYVNNTGFMCLGNSNIPLLVE